MREYLRLLVESATQDRIKPGSLLTNTIAELATQDEQVRVETVRDLDDCREAFKRALSRAKAQGELPDDLAVDTAVLLLTAMSQAINVLGKALPDREMLLGLVEMGMASLRATVPAQPAPQPIG
jgi:TetR/AcrR family transcriptional repressor of nem operon